LGSSYAFDEEEGVDPKIPPVVLPFAAQQPAAPARQSLQVMIDAVQAQALRLGPIFMPPTAVASAIQNLLNNAHLLDP
jgi:hypothetical protein